MTADRLGELAARQRHPAGRQAPIVRDPHTGRAVPRYIPAVPTPSRMERLVMAVLWGAMAGIGIWLACVYLAGGAG